jgi:hypothetical protein
MHSSPLLVGHVVHVSFHSSFVPKENPMKKNDGQVWIIGIASGI